tara:strand:- start:595 stop:882 length:288 start_codon:yes stop_codon:yes gene_type:complete
MDSFDFNDDVKKMSGIEIVLDDSFLDQDDKINLFKHLKELYNTKFEWAADTLIKCFILTHYKKFIDNMHEDDNIEKYLEEKKNSQNKSTFFENLI